MPRLPANLGAVPGLVNLENIKIDLIAAKDEAGKVFLLGSDARDLIATITHNLDAASDKAYFQRKTSCNNLPADALDEIRNSLRDEGQVFPERFDRALAAKARDMNPAVSG